MAAISRAEKRILATSIDPARGTMKIRDEEWVEKLEDGRKVKYREVKGLLRFAKMERRTLNYAAKGIESTNTERLPILIPPRGHDALPP